MIQCSVPLILSKIIVSRLKYLFWFPRISKFIRIFCKLNYMCM